MYLNHPNLKRVTKDRIHRSDNTSVHAVELESLYRDAYDPATDNLCSLVACFNDPLDETKDNSEFIIHGDKAHLLTVRATTDILDGTFGYSPYGGSYWCNSIYSVETLVRAILRYSINIYTSTTESNGDWRSLDKYELLSSVYTPMGRITIGRPSAAND